MTSINPRESIKYICLKALMIRERLGIEKKGNRLSELNRVIVNNVALFSNISFFLLFLYLISEIWKNINGSSQADLLLNFTKMFLAIISILTFISNLIDSYNTKTSENKSHILLKHKKKRAHGSLGYNAFQKNINNTEIVFENNTEPNKRKIVTEVLKDKTNIYYLFMMLLIVLSPFNQIFRAILLVRISLIDSRKILKSRFNATYPIISKILLIVAVLIFPLYINSLSELFFTSKGSVPSHYTWEG